MNDTASYLLERAYVDGAVHDNVLVEVEGGRFSKVEWSRQARPPESESAERLAGLTIPGLANCHSHVFHRALRGHTQRERGSFWTWRDQMYEVAGRLDPDTYYALALTTYREMLASGITTVGEFHYLHHQPDGTPYDEPNEMGLALVRAARDAGIRIALLDTCYLSSGFGDKPQGVQVRYSDGYALRWATRVDELALSAEVGEADDVVIGAAVHSVRAVPRDQIGQVADWARRRGRRCTCTSPSRSPRTRRAGTSTPSVPTHLLADCGALGPRTTAVHATHLSAADVHLLGEAASYACFCPTTERDLGDGIGPSRALHDGGRDAHARLRQPRRDRPVRGDARGRARRAAGHAAARPLEQRGALRRGDLPTATPAWASRTPVRSRSASAPTWSRSPPTRRAPPAPAAGSRPSCTPPRAPTCVTSWSAGRSCTRPTTSRGSAPELDAAIGAVGL
jgi:formiminoglutamate deiminase